MILVDTIKVDSESGILCCFGYESFHLYKLLVILGMKLFASWQNGSVNLLKSWHFWGL